jgi:hypothetical protein
VEREGKVGLEMRNVAGLEDCLVGFLMLLFLLVRVSVIVVGEETLSRAAKFFMVTMKLMDRERGPGFSHADHNQPVWQGAKQSLCFRRIEAVHRYSRSNDVTRYSSSHL